MDTAINLHLIDSLARSQHGLVTTNQLYAAGAGEGWIRHQVQLGRLVPVRRRVFRVVGAPVTQDQAWLAAVLSADADTVLSHESAAAAWGLLGFDPPDRIHLLTTGEPPRLPGVRGHRTRLLPEDHRTTLRRIPVTSAERTLVDASGRLHPWWLGRVIDDALRRKVIALPRLARSLEDAPVSGRRPSRAMKEALAERLPGFHPGGSAAELDVMRVLKRAGISPLPVQQYRVKVEGHTYFLDFAWPESRHAIEYDGGGGFHDSVTAFHRDRERWRRLCRADWTLWSVTSRTGQGEIVAVGVTATAGL